MGPNFVDQCHINLLKSELLKLTVVESHLQWDLNGNKLNFSIMVLKLLITKLSELEVNVPAAVELSEVT